MGNIFISTGPGWVQHNKMYVSNGGGNWTQVTKVYESVGNGIWTLIWPLTNAPTGLTASGSSPCVNSIFPDPSVALAWTSNPTHQTRIYRNSTLVGTVVEGVQTFTDTQVPVGSYLYSVSEYDTASFLESVQSLPVSVTVVNTCNAPNPPILIAVLDVSSCLLGVTTYKVLVQWISIDAGLQTRVFRNGALVGTAAAGQTSFTDNPVPGPGIYNYSLRHYWLGNESGDSDIMTVSVINPLCF
jgi:hypothetical protein